MLLSWPWSRSAFDPREAVREASHVGAPLQIQALEVRDSPIGLACPGIARRACEVLGSLRPLATAKSSHSA